jgi:arabinose-5-phosphate isomerase
MSIVENHFNELKCLNEIQKSTVKSLALFIKNTTGNIFLVGVGKNSTLAKHVADTLKSISIRAFYFSTLNCTHGDIGVLQSDDLVIYLSKSGNTEELSNIVNLIKNKEIKTILVSCNKISIISKYVDHNICLPSCKETTFMVPTTSIIVFIFFFNMVINLLVYEKHLSIHEYGNNHPAGNIGFLLNNTVSSIMEKQNLPIISENLKIIDIVFEMTKNKFPIIFYIKDKKVIGIFTDGDLRRCIQKNKANLELKIKDFINCNYYSINQNTKLSDLDINFLIQKNLLSGIPILNDQKELVGIINKDILLKNNFSC